MGQQSSQQSSENDPNPDVAWWCKLLARVCGVIAAIVAMVTGVTAAIFGIPGVSLKCIIAGVIQILLGLVVMIFESPCCCYWLDIAKPLADFADRRPFFHKAVIYGVFAIIPVALCFTVSTILGSGLVFATGVLYGLMALGKKADRGEMLARAQGQSVPPMTGDTNDDTKVNLIENEAEQTYGPGPK